MPSSPQHPCGSITVLGKTGWDIFISTGHTCLSMTWEMVGVGVFWSVLSITA